MLKLSSLPPPWAFTLSSHKKIIDDAQIKRDNYKIVLTRSGYFAGDVSVRSVKALYVRVGV